MYTHIYKYTYINTYIYIIYIYTKSCTINVSIT